MNGPNILTALVIITHPLQFFAYIEIPILDFASKETIM